MGLGGLQMGLGGHQRRKERGEDGKNENYGNPLVHRLGSFILRPGRYCEVNYD